MGASLLSIYGVLDAQFWKWLQLSLPGVSMKGSLPCSRLVIARNSQQSQIISLVKGRILLGNVYNVIQTVALQPVNYWTILLKKFAAPLERPILGPEASDPVSGIAKGAKALGIGQGRNLSTLNLDRLSLHSSRFLKTNPHASEIHIPRNISCPVSPIGSPLLRPRSQQHINGRMSPSPISSPRTASGASTPLNGGSGAIPFSNHLVYFQEGHGGLPESPNSVHISGPAHHDSNVGIFRGMQKTSHITSKLVPGENDVMGKQLSRPPKDEPYDVQSVLADRVCRQLVGDNAEINPSVDLSPNSSLLSRSNGL